MDAQRDYIPPTSAEIEARQNELDALRLLVAQRRLYRHAKRWLAARWVGMLVIGTAAPAVSVLWPSLAVAAGAVAGIWIFAGRTGFATAQARLTAQAASVQEEFDFYVFDMRRATPRSTMPTRERVAAIAGPDRQLREVAKAEQLMDWYPVDAANSGAVSVAIAQRANASYADGLLRTTATAWSLALTTWCSLLLIAALVAGMKLGTFLVGVVLPVLPAFLDVVQYVVGVRRSATDRADLARAIESRLSARTEPEPQELLVWQEQLYELRRGAPEVPDALHRLRRKGHEEAMASAADQLGRRARSDHSL